MRWHKLLVLTVIPLLLSVAILGCVPVPGDPGGLPGGGTPPGSGQGGGSGGGNGGGGGQGGGGGGGHGHGHGDVVGAPEPPLWLMLTVVAAFAAWWPAIEQTRRTE